MASQQDGALPLRPALIQDDELKSPRSGPTKGMFFFTFFTGAHPSTGCGNVSFPKYRRIANKF